MHNLSSVGVTFTICKVGLEREEAQEKISRINEISQLKGKYMVCEMFSPGTVVAYANRTGVKGGWSMGIQVPGRRRGHRPSTALRLQSAKQCTSCGYLPGLSASSQSTIFGCVQSIPASVCV